MVEGPTPEKDYGIQLAERIGFPKGVIKAAQSAIEQLRNDFYDTDAISLTKESIIRRLKKQLIQSLRRAASNQHMPHSQKMRLITALRENYLQALRQIESTVSKNLMTSSKCTPYKRTSSYEGTVHDVVDCS